MTKSAGTVPDYSSNWLQYGSRRSLLKWGGWFTLINAILMGVIATRYAVTFPAPEDEFAVAYLILTYLGHYAFLAFVPFILIVVPVTIIFPKPKIVIPLSITLISLSLAFLLIDSLVFYQNRFHINVLTITILGWKTWGFTALYFVIFVFFEYFLARWTWRRFAPPAKRKAGIVIGLTLFTSLLASHAIHIWANAHYYVPITKYSRYFPLLYPATAKRLLTEYNLIDLSQARAHQLLNNSVDADHKGLNYPLADLECAPRKPLQNVLIVVIDALRFDVLTTEIAPNLTEYSQWTSRFINHHSGGNSSRMGMFALFYGLPSSYWHTFRASQQPPIMMDVLQMHDYQLGIFASAPLHRPTSLDRTAFVGVKNLRLITETKSGTADSKDVKITSEWLNWLNKRDPSRPFFGFIYYDAPQNSDYPHDYDNIFIADNPSDEREQAFSRYKTAVNFVDSLVVQVLDDLHAKRLLDNTIVLITGDHGEEFDDSRQGYWGHGTSYSEFQVRTPLLIHWPGKEPREIAKRSSHYDIAPTLLSELFRCSNPETDYSSGRNLFSDHQWNWLIVGSYYNYAVVEPHQTTVTYPWGYFEVRDGNYQIVNSPQLKTDLMSEALTEMSRFYK